jgi:death-on-curing protein
MTEIRFLNLDEVLRIHSRMLRLYGGEQGVRDLSLLESALHMPISGMGGERFHRDVFEMAAAYAFHVLMNHPFVDGNKRTGLASAVVFLKRNGFSLRCGEPELADLLISVTAGRTDKAALANAIRNHVVPRQPR